MNIIKEVKRLTEKHQSRDPFIIAKGENIAIEFSDYEETKGYFLKIVNKKVIVINQNLEELMILFAVAHELGHAILHHNKHDILKYDKGIYFMQDDDLFNTNSIQEHQANIFAVELLKYTLDGIVIPRDLENYLLKYRHFFYSTLKFN